MLEKVRPKPRSPFVPMAALCTLYYFPNTYSPFNRIVLTLPPVKADLGKTQLIPWAFNLLITNYIPTFKMVGRVGGIAVIKRSRNNKNNFPFLVISFNTAKQIAYAIIVMPNII